MKRSIILFAAFFISMINCSAQQVDLRRRIEVNGTAQQEVMPDIIHISISLKEYMDGKTKVTISDLENQLEHAVNDAGINKSDFTVNNINSWNTIQKKKSADFLVSKQYGLTVHDLNKFNQILSKIDAKGIQSTNIDSYDYSKIEPLRNELKIKAILDAKEKAMMLLNALGQKLGDPISIIEIDNGTFNAPRAMLFQQKTMAGNDATDSDIDFKKIKLNYEIRIVFEIIK